MLQPDGALTQLRQYLEVMADRDDDPGACQVILDARLSFLLKGEIAGAENLVDQQDLRLAGGGDGKGQAHDHSCRVAAQREIEELAKLTEIGNIRNFPLDGSGGFALKVGAVPDVLPTGRVDLEPDGDVV